MNLNKAPYFDDFDEKKQYYKILNRPSKPVQNRELIQMATILQDQLDKFGRHFFKEGSIVIPGHVSSNTKVSYIRMEDSSELDSKLELFLGATVVNNSGLEAKVVHVQEKEEVYDSNGDLVSNNPTTIFLSYVNSGGNNNDIKTFLAGETVTFNYTVNSTPISDSFDIEVQNLLNSIPPVGFGSTAHIEEGIYFISGYFCYVPTQTITLDAYSETPSYRVGLTVSEEIVTPEQDNSLYDNAGGTPNFAAPGAHRLKIGLDLSKREISAYEELNSEDINTTLTDDFLQLIIIQNGILKKQAREADYAIIEDTLARRTYDESGNYSIRDFPIEIKEHSDVYPNSPDESKLVATIEAGKAYVKGYEIETLSNTNITFDKARDTESINNNTTAINYGNYVDIPIANFSNIPTLHYQNLDKVYFVDSVNNETIGHAFVRTYEYADYNVNGTIEAFLRVYLIGIQIYEGKDPNAIDLLGDENGLRYLTNSSFSIVGTDQSEQYFKLPFERVESLNNDTSYEFKKEFSNKQLSGSNGTYTTTITGDSNNKLLYTSGGEQSEATEEYIVFCKVNGGEIERANLTDVSGDVFGVTLTFDVNGTVDIANDVCFIFAPMKKETSDERVKSLITDKIVTVDVGTGSTQEFNVDWDKPISLGYSDVLRIKHIYLQDDGNRAGSGGQTPDLSVIQSTTSEFVDIKDRFIFDNGQRNSIYDHSTILLKNGEFEPTSTIHIVFDYFTHTSGDYFSVDSYSTIPYSDIGYYKESSLTNIIDFRPVISNASFGRVSTSQSYDSSKVITDKNNAPNNFSALSSDLTFYLDRIDKVYVDKNGIFGVNRGVPNINPDEPDDLEDTITLYTLFVNAYTLDVFDVESKKHDYTRFTMKDIDRLEKRITNLEYYTSLSLAEREVLDLEVTDEDGNNKFKNGFMVDSFYGHQVGDTQSPEYLCSIDTENGILRPRFNSNSIRLLIDESNSSNIKITGDVVTVDYTETPYISQTQASRAENVNPYNVLYHWAGNVSLSPSSDEWKDTVTRPAITINQDGIYDSIANVAEEAGVLGTVWDEWRANWFGSPVQTNSIRTTQRRGRRVTTTQRDFFKQNGRATREGIRTRLTPSTQTTNLGESVVNVNFTPFMRSRKVSFKATKLKPNTRVYIFFDGKDVSEYCMSESFVRFRSTSFRKRLFTDSQQKVGLGTANLVSDDSGNLEGTFIVPNNSSLRFRTGRKVFKLSDSPTNNESDETTSAETFYEARGLIETRQSTILSTRIPKIEKTQVNQNVGIRRSFLKEKSTVTWVDPLAQTFLVDTKGGVFLTSIDLYFKKKADNIPVTVQVRTVENGIPTNVVLPFAEVDLLPSQVNVDENGITKTTINFDSLVYLQEDTEYAFIVLSNSNEYELWTAYMGDDELGTSRRIVKQPYMGVMFKSQNASTWTPVQEQDIKFNLNRARFNTNPATIKFKNDEIEPRLIGDYDIVQETIDGTYTLRIKAINHNLFVGDRLRLINLEDVPNVNSVELTGANKEDFKEFNIFHVEKDFIFIDKVSATDTSIETELYLSTTLGNQIIVSPLAYFPSAVIDSFYPSIEEIEFPKTSIDWTLRAYNGKNLMNQGAGWTQSSPLDIFLNKNHILNESLLIPNEYVSPSGINDALDITGNILTEEDNISPMIDLDRVSLITVNNIVNDPVPLLSGGTIVSANDSNDRILNYLDETANKGSAHSKYISKPVRLANPADSLKVILDINKPTGTNIDIYYKVANGDSIETLDAVNWVKSTPTQFLPSDNSVSYKEENHDIDFNVEFNMYSIKIVMRSDNTSIVPSIRKLRTIALL